MQNQLKNIRIKLVRIGQYGQKLDHNTFNNLCSIPPISIKPSSDNGILVDVPGKFLPQAYNIFRDPMLSQLRKAGYTPIRTPSLSDPATVRITDPPIVINSQTRIQLADSMHSNMQFREVRTHPATKSARIQFHTSEQALQAKSIGLYLNGRYVLPQQMSIDEHITAQQCFNCLLIEKHSTKNCTERTVCSHCGGWDHKYTSCSLRSQGSKPYCINCWVEGYHQAADTHHAADNKNCPVLQKATTQKIRTNNRKKPQNTANRFTVADSWSTHIAPPIQQVNTHHTKHTKVNQGKKVNHPQQQSYWDPTRSPSYSSVAKTGNNNTVSAHPQRPKQPQQTSQPLLQRILYALNPDNLGCNNEVLPVGSPVADQILREHRNRYTNYRSLTRSCPRLNSIGLDQPKSVRNNPVLDQRALVPNSTIAPPPITAQQCFNCLQIEVHNTEDCNESTVCSHCAVRGHKLNACPQSKKGSTPNCINCWEENISATTHKATDRKKCQMLKKATAKKIRNRKWSNPQAAANSDSIAAPNQKASVPNPIHLAAPAIPKTNNAVVDLPPQQCLCKHNSGCPIIGTCYCCTCALQALYNTAKGHSPPNQDAHAEFLAKVCAAKLPCKSCGNCALCKHQQQRVNKYLITRVPADLLLPSEVITDVINPGGNSSHLPESAAPKETPVVVELDDRIAPSYVPPIPLPRTLNPPSTSSPPSPQLVAPLPPTSHSPEPMETEHQTHHPSFPPPNPAVQTPNVQILNDQPPLAIDIQVLQLPEILESIRKTVACTVLAVLCTDSRETLCHTVDALCRDNGISAPNLNSLDVAFTHPIETIKQVIGDKFVRPQGERLFPSENALFTDHSYNFSTLPSPTFTTRMSDYVMNPALKQSTQFNDLFYTVAEPMTSSKAPLPKTKDPPSPKEVEIQASSVVSDVVPHQTPSSLVTKLNVIPETPTSPAALVPCIKVTSVTFKSPVSKQAPTSLKNIDIPKYDISVSSDEDDEDADDSEDVVNSSAVASDSVSNEPKSSATSETAEEASALSFREEDSSGTKDFVVTLNKFKHLVPSSRKRGRRHVSPANLTCTSETRESASYKFVQSNNKNKTYTAGPRQDDQDDLPPPTKCQGLEKADTSQNEVDEDPYKASITEALAKVTASNLDANNSLATKPVPHIPAQPSPVYEHKNTIKKVDFSKMNCSTPKHKDSPRTTVLEIESVHNESSIEKPS